VLRDRRRHGSVAAAWLVDRVGPRGLVVATDIETRWLEPMASTLDVRHHNVIADPIEADGYDLIHARLVLEHLPPRQAVVAKLAAALRPGGWLVVDDYDVRSMSVIDPPHPAWVRVSVAVVRLLRATGNDPCFGSRLRDVLRRAGLTEVSAEGLVHPMPVPEVAPVVLPGLIRLRRPLIESGAVSAADVDQVIGEFTNHRTPHSTYSPILVSAMGRRPPTQGVTP
jgi:SAM-dependent methyltransferase